MSFLKSISHPETKITHDFSTSIYEIRTGKALPILLQIEYVKMRNQRCGALGRIKGQCIL